MPDSRAAEVSAALRTRRTDYLPRVFPAGKIRTGRFYIGNVHGDPGESLSIPLSRGAPGLRDFSGDFYGDDLDLFAAGMRMNISDAMKEAERQGYVSRQVRRAYTRREDKANGTAREQARAAENDPGNAEDQRHPKFGSRTSSTGILTQPAGPFSTSLAGTAPTASAARRFARCIGMAVHGCGVIPKDCCRSTTWSKYWLTPTSRSCAMRARTRSIGRERSFPSTCTRRGPMARHPSPRRAGRRCAGGAASSFPTTTRRAAKQPGKLQPNGRGCGRMREGRGHDRGR